MEISYKIKQKKEDFIVNEISLQPNFYPRCKSNFSYLWIEKRGMTTFDALNKILEAFNLNIGDAVAQGLKDEDGVTSQLISVPKIIFKRDLKLFNKNFTLNNYKLQIKNIVGYGLNSLVPRSLHGNSFQLIIRDLNKKHAEAFYNYCINQRFISFFNYYDNQRFGIVGGPYNTHLIGRAIINNQWVTAYKEFSKSRNSGLSNIKKPIKMDYSHCKKFFTQINFAKVRFFISSYNSYLWNKEASAYISKTVNTSQYSFSKIGLLPLVKGNIFKVYNILSIKGYEINKNTYRISPKEFMRNLFITTTIFPTSIKRDDLNNNKYKVEISFFLPTGCYATMLIKQIFIKLNNSLCLEK